MAWEVGEWRITGRGMPENGDPQLVEMNKTVRWKEKGKSLEYQFDLVENGQPVTYLGLQKFDAVKSVLSTVRNGVRIRRQFHTSGTICLHERCPAISSDNAAVR